MAGFNTAVTGLKSASQMLDVAGNNIANSSTVGFKSSRTEFADIYATSVVGAGSSNQPGSGVTVADISQDFSAGTIEFTNNNLDLAINGSGFFQLDDGQGGITYTRAGTFELDKDGFIVSKNGKNLQGYGLDALGNVLPLQDLAVTQKESAPKATETIDLSFNIDSSADATQLNPVFDKTDPGSYTYSTTVETVDSLGNSNSIRFYVVEQRPVREIYQYDISGLTPADSAAEGTFADLSQFAVDFSDSLTQLQQNFDSGTGGTNETFTINVAGLVDVTSTPVGNVTVTLDQDWSSANEATIATGLALAINTALQGASLDPASPDYVSVDDQTGNIILDTDFGTSMTLTTTGTNVENFLGSTTRTGATITGGVSFDFTVADTSGATVYSLTDINISQDWAGVTDVETDLTDLINDAINADLGTTGLDYVSVDASGVLTLVADDWVNRGATFTVDNFSGSQELTDDSLTNGFAADGSLEGALTADPENLLISGIEISFEDLLGLPSSIAGNVIAKAEFQNIDPRIDLNTLSYDPETGVLSFETFAYATQSGDMIVEGRGIPQPDGTYLAPTELNLVGGETLERPANRVETFTIDDIFTTNVDTGVDETTARYQLTIGGVPVVLPAGRTLTEIGDTLESMERALIEKNPDLQSVSFDRNTGRIDYTWKADAGNTDPLLIVGDTDLFTSTAAEVVVGDNSFQAQYRMYGFLNDTEQLDLGKVVDPGEAGFETDETEVGAVLVSFNPSTGTLEGINGSNVSSGGIAPRVTILGADPANPNDETLESDVDGLAGIQLNITGTTQFASESIVKAAAQDGYPKGDLIGVTFAETGEMVASFSNGQRQNLGLVAIASFENQAGLSAAGSTEWIATLASGAAILNPPGTGLNGTLRSAALESSNVDLSAELVKLIEAQRNFQANSKTLETQNTVTQAILQI